ncbi:MAG: ribbon-helix-helix protein, CopG family [Acidobacteriia bacterium]|nr:ribbon-helix-helix protein, CopG family [Terriglobia bacterium]
MRTTQTMTISLPPAMLKEIERVRLAENRTRSELMREALRTYLRTFYSRFPVEAPTKAEVAAIRRGRAEIRRGQYITLEQLKHELATANRKERAKKPRKLPH